MYKSRTLPQRHNLQRVPGHPGRERGRAASKMECRRDMTVPQDISAARSAGLSGDSNNGILSSCFSPSSTTPLRLNAPGTRYRHASQSPHTKSSYKDEAVARADIPHGCSRKNSEDSLHILLLEIPQVHGQGPTQGRLRRSIIRPWLYTGLATMCLLSAAQGDVFHSTHPSAFASTVSPISNTLPLRQTTPRSAPHSNLGSSPIPAMRVELPNDELGERDSFARFGQKSNTRVFPSMATAGAAGAASTQTTLPVFNAQPPLALCFDFDQTLSQQHVYQLLKRSCNGLAGVDLPKAFGGGERIQSLKNFLDKAKSLGAAVHIISHNHKSDILEALNHVGLGSHFPSESVMGWKELKESKVSSKTECAEQIAEAYGLTRRHCLMVDDDQDNLENTEGAMTYWVSSGKGLDEADMSCIIHVVETMRTTPHRLLNTMGRCVTPVPSAY